MGPFNSETKITITRSELLALLFKLNRPESAKALLRKGEDGKEYYIEAIPDNEGISILHPLEREMIKKFNRFSGI